MKLSEVLNKFTNDNFLISIEGWYDELPFSEYENEKKKEYWKEYADKTVKSMSILTTNGKPELRIRLE